MFKFITNIKYLVLSVNVIHSQIVNLLSQQGNIMSAIDDLNTSSTAAVAELDRLSALVAAVEASLAAAIAAGNQDPAIQAVADTLKAEVAKTAVVV